MRRLSLIASLVCVTAALGAADPAGVPLTRLFPDARFDPAVPTQEAVLGFRPAARPMTHDELMRYVAAVAASSRRVKVLPYATSWEGRSLVAVAVGDESTIWDLDAFRAAHARRTDPRKSRSGEDSTAKAVAWIAYGIHGDEISSTDAAAAVLYWLAAGEDEPARTIRSRTLVLIDPCENPDGRERYLSQIRWFAHQTPSADLEDLSHTSIWPYGRGNHFLVDLNRDWITLVHPESARVDEIARWNPQLMVDSHEMGAEDTYLFSPARAPFNPFLPKDYLTWARRYAQDQGRALDARSYPYYTREWNEEFFPGYGSSWAMYRGAVGILYEMSGTDGTAVRKASGELRTYGEAVEHHVISSVANLKTLAATASDALAATVAARRDAIERGSKGKVRAWVLRRDRLPERTDALARLLARQGIEVARLASRTTAAGLTDGATGQTRSVDLPAGSYLIPMDQPSGHLARAILDPHVPMEASFLREERQFLETGKGTRLYDATAWSLPLLYGIEAYWAGTRPAGDWRSEPAPAAPAGGLRDAPPASTAFGWVFDGSSDEAGHALADLLQAGVKVRLAEKPFQVDGRAYRPGAVLVAKEANLAGVASTLDEVGKRRGVTIVPVSTALAEEGADLGGRYFHALVPPRIGVLTGPAVSRDAYGSIWHYLDTIAGVRFTAVDLTALPRTDLRRYNVLVVPPVGWSTEAIRAILGKAGVDALKQWIEAGGTLVAIGSGAELLADKELGLTKARLRSQALDVAPPPVWSLGAEEALAAGVLTAPGLSVAARDDKKPPVKRSSPYDVAPVIGPGARPFVDGVDLGTGIGGTPVDIDTWLKPTLPPGQTAPKDDDRRRADDRLRRFAPQGALLRVDLDADLFLGWGLPDDLTAWMGSDEALVARPPVRVAAAFSGVDTLHRGGLLWPEAAARLARTAYATREAVGRGQIILFIDNPVFRGWTVGTRRLFLNALLYGPGVGAEPPAPW
jgi:hypothetical protein